jgi:hypothetical protein
MINPKIEPHAADHHHREHDDDEVGAHQRSVPGWIGADSTPAMPPDRRRSVGQRPQGTLMPKARTRVGFGGGAYQRQAGSFDQVPGSDAHRSARTPRPSRDRTVGT